MNKKLLIVLLVPFFFFYGMPAHALEKENRLWEDETVYHIVIDRFNDANTENNKGVDVREATAFNGGDFEGIQKKLDYIKDLGFTTISLSPIFDNEAKGFAGYNVKDFYKTEEHYGSLKEFKQLVREAHKRQIRVIIEFPTFSVGSSNEWVKDPAKKEWFQPNPRKLEGSSFNTKALNGLPRLDQSQPDVHAYIVDAAKWWIKKTDIDGYYIPFINEAPISMWQDFNTEVKKEKKNFFMIGLDPDNDVEKAKAYEQAGFDGTLNVDGMEPVRKAFATSDRSSKEALANIESLQPGLEHPGRTGNLVDNLFTNRFTRDIVNENRNPGTRWNLALTYLYTVPGIPVIMYGSEIALDGGSYPDNARFMGFKAEKEIIDHATKVGKLRQELPALTRGSFDVLYEKDGMAVYKRAYKNEVIITAINNTSKTQNVTLSSKDLADHMELRGLLAGDLVREKDGKYTIIINREESEIYALADKTGINKGFIGAILSVWIVFAIFILIIMKRSKRKR
ncbi:alpha-amylase family glycosyl hydrolase [Bacillus sp. 1P06AnD]|uniref:alpha-amylase family glycosyl hydrolase n=1 Tax=Bacillus sp. 1P06AnD TaxID=3132208 RepID=UPI0039A09756